MLAKCIGDAACATSWRVSCAALLQPLLQAPQAATASKCCFSHRSYKCSKCTAAVEPELMASAEVLRARRALCWPLCHAHHDVAHTRQASTFCAHYALLLPCALLPGRPAGSCAGPCPCIQGGSCTHPGSQPHYPAASRSDRLTTPTQVQACQRC